MATENIKNKEDKYYCELCDYECSKLFCWNQHLTTSKHNNATNGYIKATAKYDCICGKKFKHHSSFYRHKKLCVKENNTEKNAENAENINNSQLLGLILQQSKENVELKNLLLEQNKMMMELVVKEKNTIINNNNTNTNTNSHNKTFNLQFFLNETCKNAMNIKDFVDSIKLQLTDLENVGRLGYVDGLSKIIIKNLNALDVTERPVHCSDPKRDTMYVKDEDKWEKEAEDNHIVLKAIEDIANKNSKQVKEWKIKNPDCSSSKSNKSDQYCHILMKVVCSNNDDNNAKVLKKIAKEVTIDKSL